MLFEVVIWDELCPNDGPALLPPEHIRILTTQVDVTVLGLVGGAPGGETPRVE